MKNTAIFILKKYVAELMVASVLLSLWPVFFDPPFLEIKTATLGSFIVVLLGSFATGYILFVCGIGTASLFITQKPNLKFIAICLLSSLYVLINFTNSPKNEVTIPVALGVIVVNVMLAIFVFRSTQRD